MYSNAEETKLAREKLTELENKEKKQQEELKKKEAADAELAAKPKLNELLSSFNEIESEKSSVYAGVKMKGQYGLTVEVSDLWNRASKDSKIGCVKHVSIL